jgi:hypothetical protein
MRSCDIAKEKGRNTEERLAFMLTKGTVSRTASHDKD